MERLETYIRHNTIDFIESVFEKHFALELELNHGGINETAALYNGLTDVVEYVTNEILYDRNKTMFIFMKSTLSKFNNVFYDKLIIKKTDRNEDGGYLPDKSEYDKDSMKFGQVIIEISGNIIRYSEIYRTLVHELTHAWDDYQRYIKGDTFITYRKMLGKDSLYRDLIDLFGDDYAKQLCKRVLYNITSIEKNAYIADIMGEIESKKDEISSYKDMIKIYNETDGAKTFKTIHTALLYLKDDKFPNVTLQEFADAYNDIMGNYGEPDAIIKKLIKRYEKVLQKIDVILPKRYCLMMNRKTISESGRPAPGGRDMITDMVKMINNCH